MLLRSVELATRSNYYPNDAITKNINILFDMMQHKNIITPNDPNLADPNILSHGHDH